MKKLRITEYICLFIIAMSLGIIGYIKNVYAAETAAEVEIDLSAGQEEMTDGADGLQEPAEFKISRTELEVTIGKEKQLKVSGASQKVKWESLNTNIAAVSQDGKVTGKKYGTATVRAISGDQQASCKVTVYASKKQANKWIEKNGRCYYYGKYGQKVTGRAKIGGKAYYFDSQGRQRTGWLKIGKTYYYYNIAKAAKGYLVKNKTVNQIKIAKSGKAQITGRNQTKAYILACCNDMVFENTNWKMTRNEALKKLFTDLAQGKSIVYKNIGGFKNKGSWPENYTMVYLENGYGDCYTAGCVYAYLAVALGCKEVYAQSSGSHGWCRIDGKYYDPNWAFWGTKNIYDGFAAPEEVSGKGGRPGWKKAASYSVKLS